MHDLPLEVSEQSCITHYCDTHTHTQEWCVIRDYTNSDIFLLDIYFSGFEKSPHDDRIDKYFPLQCTPAPAKDYDFQPQAGTKPFRSNLYAAEGGEFLH